ncbi:MAG: efflux RND transporter periplasmic adaptor subunit [Bacteroidales bacterium]|nr:efflux RND transporter periplasmic adaptor subunit [Bacteroidales bacterium]
MRNGILVLMFILMVILGSCHHENSKRSIPSASDTIRVKTIELKKSIISLPITVSGQFITDDETFLSFKTGGIVNGILVNEGDYVRKGQVLATLDLTEIKAQVSQAELGHEKAKRDFARVENLYKDSVATLEQYQNCKTALDLSSAALAGANFNLNYSQILAITDGYILKKFVNVGQIVAPGSPIFQCNGAGNKMWKLRASLSDKEWSVIAVGDPAEISTDAFSGEVLNGTVSTKSKGTDLYTGAFFIEIEIKKTINALASGLFGKAVITPKNQTAFWSIPYEALLDGNAGQGFVFITNNNTVAQKVKITIAAIGKDVVYVSSGLDNMQNLIISGSAYLSGGSLIKVVNN